MAESTILIGESALVRRLVPAVRWIFGPAALLFLAIAGFGARETLAAIVSQAQWPGLIGAVALWASLHLLSPTFSILALRSLGSEVRYRDALAIHARRLPARSLPGGIWHTVSRMVDLHHLGVIRTHLAALVLLENAIPLSIAGILGGGFLLATGQASIVALGCIGVGIALLALVPNLLKHRALLNASYPITRNYAAAILITIGFWLIAGTAFATYWNSFPKVHAQSSLLGIYAAYLLGWAAGFLAVIAPQGVGVFEFVAGALLRGVLPLGGIALLVAGFRVVILIADAIAYGVYASVHFLRRVSLQLH